MRKIVILAVVVLLLVMGASALTFWVAVSPPRTFATILVSLFGQHAIATSSGGGGGVDAGVAEKIQRATLLVSALTFGVTAIGAVFTVVFAWRKDSRETRELTLKVAHLELQISELKSKSATVPA
jgi:hypothetical protein